MDFIIPTDNIKRIEKSYNKVEALKKYNAGVLLSETATSPAYLGKETLLMNFSSLSEVFRLLDDTETVKTKYNSSRENSGSSWTVFKSYIEAEETFRYAPQKVAEFKASDIVINDYGESGNTVNYDVTGDYIDIGRYLEGVPEVFGSMHMGNYRGVRVKLVVNGAMSAGINIEVLNERSKRIIRLVDWLETQGIRVSLNIVFSNKCAHVDIRVKDYSEPLNIFDIAVATHGDFFRRIVFRLFELSKTLEGGYGNAYSFDYAVEGYKYSLKNLDEMFVGLISRCNSKESVNKDFNRVEKHIMKLIESGDFKQVVMSSELREEDV